MSIYCLAFGRNLDQEALAKYREKAPIPLKKHHGKLLVSTPKVEVLEGQPETYEASVILEFPTLEDARNWRQDPDLQSIHALRVGSGDWTVQILTPPQ
ncbi:DUF1330 domain-containing protein [Curvivirga aplysinae]|uniref:DUF1330 domain-containing protein n=1 Tax=Curvivirga aplysinae TaxID=2529852 RepID=UPI0012BD74B9|nr:DUF1330 domain-containing protein [Curvivirga aplysinae]MTI11135.1 DUF1330 domain-containing protein [Curvivirga aplysinae]